MASTPCGFNIRIRRLRGSYVAYGRAMSIALSRAHSPVHQVDIFALADGISVPISWESPPILDR